MSLFFLNRCLWFLIEPLISKSEDYNYSFFRKMLENIKQCKDAQDPEDEAANKVKSLYIYLLQ